MKSFEINPDPASAEKKPQTEKPASAYNQS